MKKKIIALATLVAMVCMMFAFSIPTFAYDWPGTIDQAAMPSGKGTKEDPFVITSEHQFWAMSYRNYYGSSSDYGYFGCADCYNNRCDSKHEHYFVLGADITFTLGKKTTSSLAYGFYPIGCYNDSYAFNGHLDGKGHKLIDFRLKPKDGKYWGLFGRSKHASFKNIIFEGATFEQQKSLAGTFSPVNYSAFLVGYAQDTTFENITFTKCTMTANSEIGLVCGQADNCKFINIQIDDGCTVTSTNTEVGAVAGIMKGEGYIANSKVEAKVEGYSNIGGYVGRVIPSSANSINFNHVERGNQVKLTKHPDPSNPTLQIDSMGVFVGVGDKGFSDANIKNATLYIPDHNAENVYDDASQKLKIYYRYTGKCQGNDGNYNATGFTQQTLDEKVIFNKDDKFFLEIDPAFADGDYKIYSYLNNAQDGKMCLDIDGAGAMANGGNLHLWSAEGNNKAAFNVFTLTWDAKVKAYIIKAKHSGKVMDVGGWTSDPGTNIAQWDDEGMDDQRWRFASAGDGYYYIYNLQKGYMDAPGCSKSKLPADNTNIQCYSFTGADNQKFKLESVDANGNPINTGSVLSSGNIWIIVAVAVVVIVGVAALVIVKKKKTPALADGVTVENEDDE